MGAGAGIGADWAWIPQAASQARGIRGVDPRQADKRRFGEIPQLRKEDKFASVSAPAPIVTDLTSGIGEVLQIDRAESVSDHEGPSI